MGGVLIAELRGKRNAAVAEDEDYLTSTVFGELRHVRDREFWVALFQHAVSSGVPRTTLESKLRDQGIELPQSCEWHISFWPYFSGYGEPDLILRLRTQTGRLIHLLIEVKLHSGKSGSGDDQLARYFSLLKDASAIPELGGSGSFAAVIYLTLKSGIADVVESLERIPDPSASSYIFSVQWQDIAQVAFSFAERSQHLKEIGMFLRKRGYEMFNGFRECELSLTRGSFYAPTYFLGLRELPATLTGEFYG